MIIKKNPINQKQGITLIALIITIIVMLILVAVTIRVAVKGELFGYAGKAVGDTKEAKALEQLETVRMGWEIEKNVDPDATIAEFLAKEKENGRIDNYTELENNEYYIEKDGYQKKVQGEQLITFYIYHSSDNTVEEITQREGKSFNIVNLVKTDFFYAGYFSDYEGKGSYAGDGVEAIDGTEIAYDGMNATWVAEEAYTEKGTSMHPQEGVTYYLKELPYMYTNQKNKYFYHHNNLQITDLFILNVTDDLCYKERGVLINSPNNREECQIWEEAIDINLSNGTQQTYTPADTFGNGITSGGYVTLTNLKKYIKADAVIKIEAYYITLDDVLIGFQHRMKKIELNDLTTTNFTATTITSFDD